MGKGRITHVGHVVGCDNRTPAVYRNYNVFFRETKLFYISPRGSKYRKKDGHAIGGWPLLRIDFDNFRKLDE